MARYMFEATYTHEGVRGLAREGGTNRQAAITRVLEALGGRLEAYYFSFGDADAIAIVELPDNVSAAAISLAVNAAGALRIKTSVLLTPEEMDAAVRKHVDYRSPGA